MSKEKLMIVLAVAALAFAPALVKAEEGSSAPSFAMKKQGRVPFEAVSASATQTEGQETSPAAIEPAAGAEDEADAPQTSRSAVEDQIRLPRKN
jgi:adenine/guanine phosphoribosyltransferase-like PRPP-binding protein